MRRRQEFRRVAEMPLAHDAGMITGLPQKRAEGLLVVAQADLRIRSERRAAKSKTIGLTTGEQRDA